MVEPGPSDCEVKVDGQWLAVGLVEALGQFVAAEKRCPVCHGRMAISSTFTAKERRFLIHHRKHAGCPLLPKIYCGTPSPHPNPIE